MKIARLASPILIASLVAGLVAASAASAALPEFRPAAGTYDGNASAGTLKAGENTVTCASAVFSGEIASPRLLGISSYIHFLNCESSGATDQNCPVRNPGSNLSLIFTLPLHAVLGLALPSHLVALLVLPATGKHIVTLEGNACTPETSITGSIAGLVTPVGVPTLESSVTFLPNGITDLDVLGGLAKPSLNAFSVTATLETVAHLTWHTDVEIT